MFPVVKWALGNPWHAWQVVTQIIMYNNCNQLPIKSKTLGNKVLTTIKT